jgi:hypothetical protein
MQPNFLVHKTSQTCVPQQLVLKAISDSRQEHENPKTLILLLCIACTKTPVKLCFHNLLLPIFGIFLEDSPSLIV